MICRMQNEMKIKKNIALATIAKYRGEKRARVGELEFSGTRESPRNYRHTYIYIHVRIRTWLQSIYSPSPFIKRVVRESRSRDIAFSNDFPLGVDFRVTWKTLKPRARSPVDISIFISFVFLFFCCYYFLNPVPHFVRNNRECSVGTACSHACT